MNFPHRFRRQSGVAVAIGMLFSSSWVSAQVPPFRPDPCDFFNAALDFDGDFREDVDWNLYECRWLVEPWPPSPLPEIQITRGESFALADSTRIWMAADTNRIPFGALIGDSNGPELQPVSSYGPVNPGSGRDMVAMTVGDDGGGQRHGWIRRSTQSGGFSEIEFNRDTNQPIALGLPAEPRWLPRLDSGQEELPPPHPVARQSGILASLDWAPASFSFGVVALAPATNGVLFGVGLNDPPAGSSSDPWQAYLFSMNLDGSRFRTVARLGTNSTDQPEYSLIWTSQGRLLVNQIAGPLFRYDPATDVLINLRTNRIGIPRLRSSLRQLSDGNLYSTTGTLLVVLDSEGESARTLSLGNHGLRELNVGLVEDATGWLYLVAQSGGDGNAGGILRCRRDGTESSVLIHFAALSGSPADYLPSRDLLATSVKSPLCLARDGSLYGTMRQRLFNLVYRVAADGTLRLVHFNQWANPEGRFTNGLGGLTWVGPFPRGLSGGLAEADDGHLYGVAQYEWNGNYLPFPAAMMRIRIPGGSLETLSQNSLLQSWGNLDSQSPMHRTVPCVRGANGVLLVGGHQGVMSYMPGMNGVRALRFTGRDSRWSPRVLGPPLRDDERRYLMITPIGGAFREGFISAVNADGSDGRVLHSFSGGDGDVLNPSGFLALGDGGWVYGTSHRGNFHEFSPQLWRLHPDTGAFQALATLPGREEGRPALPYGLLRGRDGRIYGTTPYGGAADLGTLYRHDPEENRITILHEFGVAPGDQWQPWPQLLEGSDGHLYGLASGENVGPNAPDGWFRMALDGSGYQVLGTLERSAASPLQITGGLTEVGDHRFYCVRSLPASAPTNAPTLGQILRLTLPASHADPGKVEVLYDNAAGAEPFLAPVGNLIEMPDGVLLGLGRDPKTAVFTVNPGTGDVRRVHRWGMRGTFRDLAVLDRFAGVVLEQDGSLVVPVDGALVRVNLARPAPPEALPGLKFSGVYGDFTPYLRPDQLFTNAFFLTGATGLPEGVRLLGAADGVSSGAVTGRFLETGIFEAEVFTADGFWPATVITNRITFDIRNRPLTVKGPVAIWATGTPASLPAATVEGLLWDDVSKVTLTWELEEGAAECAGTYPVHPEFQDPENRLRYYAVSVQDGRVTVVDRETRMVQVNGDTYLEFPPLSDHRFVVKEAISLEGPWTLRLSTRGRASGVNRFRLDPAGDGRERYFRIEASY